MKVLYRVLIILAVLLVVFFYLNQPVKENEPLKAPNSEGRVIPQKMAPDVNDSAVERPTKGLSTLVGQSTRKLTKKLGNPDRKSPSAYDFDWWVYQKSPSNYLLVGVKNHKVKQVYMTGSEADASPFKIGQGIDELYRNTITDTEVTVKIQHNIYTFILNEDDLQTRILVMYDGLYAQLYFDAIDKTLEAVRYIDGPTLVKQHPYDMTYVGDLITPSVPSSYKQEEIDLENQKQLLELTNVYRVQKGLPALLSAEDLNKLAMAHSEKLAVNKISKEEQESDAFKDRLKNAEIQFDSAGENVTEDYLDAPEAINGLLNSEKHRNTLLNEQFNQIGTGAFGKHFTQVFIQRNETENY
ncbi:CAP-associated domain-containing protein [Rummeliibacillus sp. SL167]|uniref:CAP domain-containing protein n=1 Tax=Rummeliibacillus sp. SL167 TaxID=2579792 RepID=UPI0011B73CCE|nr:CAP-associated domain-containing protein [Rummeliibacillus sp. SL167]